MYTCVRCYWSVLVWLAIYVLSRLLSLQLPHQVLCMLNEAMRRARSIQGSHKGCTHCLCDISRW
jgi:hypothetical protein